jgi:hypothetical protein
VKDARALALSAASTFGLFAVTYLLYRRTLTGGRPVLWALGVSLTFVVVFGLARGRLGRPPSGTPAFREALYLALTVAGLVLLVGWFAVAR